MGMVIFWFKKFKTPKGCLACVLAVKAWMAGSSPAMTWREFWFASELMVTDPLRAGPPVTGSPRAKRNKSFFASFFSTKEVLACFLEGGA